MSVKLHLWSAATGLLSILFGFLGRLVPAYYFSWLRFPESEKLPLGHSFLYSVLRRDSARQVGRVSSTYERDDSREE